MKKNLKGLKTNTKKSRGTSNTENHKGNLNTEIIMNITKQSIKMNMDIRNMGEVVTAGVLVTTM